MEPVNDRTIQDNIGKLFVFYVFPKKKQIAGYNIHIYIYIYIYIHIYIYIYICIYAPGPATPHPPPVKGNNRVYVIVPFLAFSQWKIVRSIKLIKGNKSITLVFHLTH